MTENVLPDVESRCTSTLEATSDILYIQPALTLLQRKEQGNQMKRTRLTGGGQTAILFSLILAISAGTAVGGEKWPRFRGPGGSGISREEGFPAKWTSGDYLWKTELPGRGHSSPCVWQDHVFVTAAKDGGRRRLLIDISAATGDIRWLHTFESSTEEIHHLSSYASGTPATDGQRVYVAFTSEEGIQLAAFDFEGEEAWRVDLGPWVNRPPHGSGTSPIVFEDLVILSVSQEGPSFVAGIERATGKIRWKNERQGQATAHSTPFVVQQPGGDPRLFLASTADGIASLDPRTGRLLFRAPVLSSRVVASPTYGHGLVFATCGRAGRGSFLAAVKANSAGELGEADLSWKRRRELPYVPTPVVHGGYLFLWGDNGVVVCVSAKTGDEVWKHRVGGDYSGSPICVDGKLYCVARNGRVVVIAAKPQFELLGENSLGEGSHSTPATAGGRLFFRSFKHLFSLGAKPQSEVLGK